MAKNTTSALIIFLSCSLCAFKVKREREREGENEDAVRTGRAGEMEVSEEKFMLMIITKSGHHTSLIRMYRLSLHVLVSFVVSSLLITANTQ